MSVIVVQAAAANDVFDARPSAHGQALRDIESTARVTLAELRRLLGRSEATRRSTHRNRALVESMSSSSRYGAGLESW